MFDNEAFILRTMNTQNPEGLPTLIIAHLKPISSRALSWSRNRLVDGLSQ
jgi:hypothetical protein